MKTTTVPAQVTTIEDKIAGNLNLSQLLLLAASVFVGFGLYIVVPPSMKFSIPKFLLCLIVMLFFASLSIRIRGKILVRWLGILLRYNLRPRYYIFNKNDLYLRDEGVTVETEVETAHRAQKTRKEQPHLHIPLPQIVQLETAMADPLSQLAFETNKKGGIRVRITEIK